MWKLFGLALHLHNIFFTLIINIWFSHFVFCDKWFFDNKSGMLFSGRMSYLWFVKIHCLESQSLASPVQYYLLPRGQKRLIWWGWTGIFNKPFIKKNSFMNSTEFDRWIINQTNQPKYPSNLVYKTTVAYFFIQ